MSNQQDGARGFLSPQSTAIAASVMSFLAMVVIVMGYAAVFPEHGVLAVALSLCPATLLFLWQLFSLTQYQSLRLVDGEVHAMKEEDEGMFGKVARLIKFSHRRWVFKHFGSPLLLGLLGLVLLTAR